MKLVRNLTKHLAAIFRQSGRPLSTSKLVGIYLSQTNSREAYSSELMQNRQRRNGKYSHTRERA